MNHEELENCSSNLKYLIKCTTPAFSQANYSPNQTFPGLNISLSTLKNALYGRRISDHTRSLIAFSFSSALSDPDHPAISTEDLCMPADEFKAHFPPDAFSPSRNIPSQIHLSLFENKLYRCYYLLANSVSSAYLGYFKLFHIGNKYCACMVRGIQDFSLFPELQNNFDSPENLIQCCNDNYRKNDSYIREKTIHLNIAGPDDISFTPHCITIHFHTTEDDPCYSTMFWNINISNNVQPLSYIGGSSLMVDTNDGKRRINIASYKMGLQSITMKTSHQTIALRPLDHRDPDLLNILSIKSDHGVLSIDDNDDNQWFHFLLDHCQTSNPSDTSENAKISELIFSLKQLKNEYQSQLTRLKDFLDLQESSERKL